MTDEVNTYSYDSFGNIQQMGNFGFEQAYTPENRLWGYAYDAAGNLLTDRLTNTMTYDANERIAVLNGTHYSYLPTGERVGKSGANATDYVYFGGRQIARLSGGQWTDLIYGANGLLAEVPGTQAGVPEYRMLDHLGTEIGSISAAGQVTINDYAPFGQAIGGTDNDPYKFTGKERDAESGLDYFGARYYASTLGRWTSPDLPFADQNPENPQSWNLYAYVRNNPVDSFDTNGRVTWLIGGTWHKSSDWEPSSPLGQEMAGFFDPNDDDVEQIPWSGGNSASARAELAAAISTAMANHAWKPGEQNNIVCHSHGCNGVMAALPTLMTDGFFVNNLVSLGQPMRGDYPYSGGVDAWWNVYAGNDLVQKLGGRVPLFGGRTNSNATNIRVDTEKNPIAAHGALHNDWLTRMQWEMFIRGAQNDGQQKQKSDKPCINSIGTVVPC